MKRKYIKVYGKYLQFRKRVPRYDTGEYAKLWDITKTSKWGYARIIDVVTSTQETFDGDFTFVGLKKQRLYVGGYQLTAKKLDMVIVYY